MSEGDLPVEAIDLTFVPRARPGISSVDLDSEGLLYDEERGSWHLLNPTAHAIWRFSDGSGTVEELARDLAAAYEADLDTVRIGTLEAVRELAREGLLAGIRAEVEGSPTHAHHDHEQLSQEDAPSSPRYLPVPPST